MLVTEGLLLQIDCNNLFLRNQFNYFEELYPDSYLIHDNTGELNYFPYQDYGIKGVATSPYSPNLNAYAERFIRSVRHECLDWFIIFSEKQLRNILKQYMEYYNFVVLARLLLV
jgi:hypothetical protein